MKIVTEWCILLSFCLQRKSAKGKEKKQRKKEVSSVESAWASSLELVVDMVSVMCLF